jgi:hypothetical protein
MPESTDPGAAHHDEWNEFRRRIEETYHAYRAATGSEGKRLLESYLAALRSLEQFMFKRPPS